jgi:nitrogen regulatory protein PII
MKLVKSIFRPSRIDEVRAALEKIHVPGMTVTDVRGHGRQKGHTAIYRGQEYEVVLIPKVEIELVVPDDRVEEVVRAISSAARTGEIGDGRIFIQTVEQAFKIRTGEMEGG